MKKFAVIFALAFGLPYTTGVAAETISVGASPVPHAEILEFVKPLVAKDGVELKIVEFNDYVQPNLAVNDGQLDANYAVHRPYLQSLVKEHGLQNLKEVAGVHIEPMAVYSRTLTDITKVSEGAAVAIPNDPTNGGRALLLLQKAGLITLEDPESITATPLDIKDNPKGLKFSELEPPQLPRSLDEVEIAVINTNFAIDAGLSPIKDSIFIENKESPYVNLLIANTESAEKTGIKSLIKALNSEDTRKFITEKFEGAVVPAF